MPAVDSSLRRCASTLDERFPQLLWSSRKVGTGSARSSHRMRRAQRRPSRSSSAMTGLPVFDPRTRRPGSGMVRDVGLVDFKRLEFRVGLNSEAYKEPPSSSTSEEEVH